MASRTLLFLKLTILILLATTGFGIDADYKIVFELIAVTLFFLIQFSFMKRSARIPFFDRFRIDLDILVFITFACVATVQAMSHTVDTDIPRFKQLLRAIYYFYVVFVTTPLSQRFRPLLIGIFTILLFSSFPFHWSYVIGHLKSIPLLLITLYLVLDRFYGASEARVRNMKPIEWIPLVVIPVSVLLASLYRNRYLSGVEALFGSLAAILLFLPVRYSEQATEREYFYLLFSFATSQTFFFLYGVAAKMFNDPNYDPFVTKVAFLAGVNVNDISGFIILIFPLALALILDEERRNEHSAKISLTLLFFVNVLLLYVVKSRFAWPVAIVSSLFFYALYQMKTASRENRAFVPGKILLYAVLPASLLLIVLLSVFHERLPFLFSMKSLYIRFELWDLALDAIRHHPFSGTGAGNYTALASQPVLFSSPGAFENVKLQFLDGTFVHCHNLFLQLWLNGGVVHLLAFLAFVAMLFVKKVRTIRTASLYSDALLTVLIAVLLQGAMNYHFMDPAYSLFVWVVFGLLSREKPEEHEAPVSFRKYDRLLAFATALAAVVVLYHSIAVFFESRALAAVKSIRHSNLSGALVLEAEEGGDLRQSVARARSGSEEIEWALLLYPRSVVLSQYGGEMNYFLSKHETDRRFHERARHHYEASVRLDPDRPFGYRRLLDLSSDEGLPSDEAIVRNLERTDPLHLIEARPPVPF